MRNTNAVDLIRNFKVHERRINKGDVKTLYK